MKQSFYVFICFKLLSIGLFAQGTITYGDRGIKPFLVIAGDLAKLKDTPDTFKDAITMAGTGMDFNGYNMRRLMRQATLGFNFIDRKEFVKITPEKWIDEQLKVSSPNMFEKKVKNRKNWVDYVVGLGYDFNIVWLKHILNNRTEYLKQGLAQVFRQNFVIPRASEFIYRHVDGQANFNDLLLRNTSGNFKNHLLGLSLHTSNCIYSSYLNISKANPERNLFPDENYARKIMHLFTNGLHQLNKEGIKKIGILGTPFPIYKQRHNEELAKVFTGLIMVKEGQYSKLNRSNFLGMDIWNIDLTYPIIVFEDWNEPDTKSFLNFIIPVGQKGLKDIEMAEGRIILHPNVDSFIGKQLLQKLVTSNPSSAYVKKVAETLINNSYI